MAPSREYKASVAVLQYCPPVLLLFGTFGNVTAIFILRRMKMKRSAMPVYLTALAVSDTSLLYTGLLRYWILNVFQLDVRTVHPAVCKMHTWLVYSLISISAWILSFLTVERTVSVWWPHRVSLLCTRTKATVIIVGIVFTSLAVNSHFLYGLDLVTVNGTCMCFPPSQSYLQFFDTVWSWVDLTLASLIPFTVLLVGNSLILYRVYSSERSARYLGSVRSDVMVTQRKKTMSSMTMTLVALSAVFFVTTFPICVYNIIEHYIDHNGLDVANNGPDSLRLAWAVVNVLVYTNTSVNFYLYCLSGTNFRKELRKCLCCQQAPPPSSTKHVLHHEMIHVRFNHDALRDNRHHQQHPEHHQDARRFDGEAHFPRSEGTGKDTPDGVSIWTNSQILHHEPTHPHYDSSVDF
ncbi:cysteinyl leukotriene receptor 1-like [Babylonia areolata]|uniref:cysteinyl leukotriene receptor 1-like n=1 Tax=Babylonia areolata TaxID=304850 RepID=UPI003FD207C0